MADLTPEQSRRRWVNIGEVVAVGGLLISGLALWNSWGRNNQETTTVVEKARAIPLVLRGHVEDGGKAIRLEPLESGHALDGLNITATQPASGSAAYGDEPILSSAQVESWLPVDRKHEGIGSVTVVVSAGYVERGESRSTKQRYRISYRWKDGGLFGGKALRLTGFNRA